ncbi:MAG: hypothetical protein C0594_00640 [Marinilabiliales bacterium]|nr:MAG: hypothetical protein C0594_00640 [Marinilabiliales bacterium]
MPFKKHTQLWIVLLILAVSSCSPLSNIPVDVLMPADNFPDTQPRKVIIVDNSGIYNYNNMEDGWFASTYKDKLLQAVLDKVSNSGVFKFVDTLTNSVKKIDKDEAWKICYQNKADYMILLEYTNGNYKQGYNDFSDDYQVSTNVEWGYDFYSYWKMYSFDKNRFFAKTRCGSSDGGLIGVNSTQLAYDYAYKSLNYFVQEHSFKVANTIVPCWSTVMRKYYTDGNDELGLADLAMKIYNWDEAIEIWKVQALSKKRLVARNAFYNLALFSETIGEIDQAILYLEQARRKLPSNKIFKYKRKLKKRLKQYNLLNKQYDMLAE